MNQKSRRRIEERTAVSICLRDKGATDKTPTHTTYDRQIMVVLANESIDHTDSLNHTQSSATI